MTRKLIGGMMNSDLDIPWGLSEFSRPEVLHTDADRCVDELRRECAHCARRFLSPAEILICFWCDAMGHQGNTREFCGECGKENHNES